MLRRVDEDVSYALWLVKVAPGPETRRQVALLSEHLKHLLVAVVDDRAVVRDGQARRHLCTAGGPLYLSPR